MERNHHFYSAECFGIKCNDGSFYFALILKENLSIVLLVLTNSLCCFPY